MLQEHRSAIPPSVSCHLSSHPSSPLSSRPSSLPFCPPSCPPSCLPSSPPSWVQDTPGWDTQTTTPQHTNNIISTITTRTHSRNRPHSKETDSNSTKTYIIHGVIRWPQRSQAVERLWVVIVIQRHHCDSKGATRNLRLAILPNSPVSQRESKRLPNSNHELQGRKKVLEVVVWSGIGGMHELGATGARYRRANLILEEREGAFSADSRARRDTGRVHSVSGVQSRLPCVLSAPTPESPGINPL